MHTHTTQASNSQAQLVQTRFLGSNFYGRVYAYFEVKPRNINGGIFEGLGYLNGDQTAISIATNSQRLFILYFRNNPFLDTMSPASQTVPVGKWFCLEWNVRPVEGTNNHIWIDGVEVAGLVRGGTLAKEPSGTFKVDPFSEARIGWSHSAHNDPDPFTDIWFDDIAFGPERIGCL
ncbi:MAG: hypothetical protein SFV15_00610 [Polyangiaceae bacterium]|nr:hypothetical protein [Polyangiaceae bacterium]